MTIAEFTNRAAYDAYEASERTRLGLPIIGKNQKTGRADPTKQQTTSVTSPITNPNNSRIACFIDRTASLTGLTTITEDEAKTRGYIPDFEVDTKPDGSIEIKEKKRTTTTPRGGGPTTITP